VVIDFNNIIRIEFVIYNLFILNKN